MCAVDDVQNVQHYQDPESKIFRAALADVERRFGVDKGFVVLAPSGIRLFSMTCHSGGEAEPLSDGSRVAGEAWDGHGLLRQGVLDPAAVAADPKVAGLRQALERYAAIPRAQRLLPEDWRPGLRPRRDLPVDIGPDQVVLRLTSRRVPAEGLRPDTPHPSESGQLWRWNQDWLVLEPSEARRFLAPADGGTAVVPAELVREIAGYYVDSTGGQAKNLPPDEIREAVLHSTVVGTGGGVTSVRLVGRVASRAFTGRLFGYAQYQREQERLTAFQLAAIGTGGKDGARQGLGFLFVLSRGPLERSYPPLDLRPFDPERPRAADARDAPRENQRQRFVPSRPPEAVVVEWQHRLRDRLGRELEGRRGPSIELPSLGGVVATITAIDARGTLALRLATGGSMQSPWSLLREPEHRNLALALRRDFDPDDHCLAGFFLMLSGEVQAADQELSKAGAAGEAVRALFAPAP